MFSVSSFPGMACIGKFSRRTSHILRCFGPLPSHVISRLISPIIRARRKTITRQKTTDFHVVRALTNMGIVIRKPFVQKELASIFVFATGLVEITGSTKTWTTLEEFIVELYKFYSTKTKDVPYRLKLDDFRALVMEISRARSKYKTWRDSNGMVSVNVDVVSPVSSLSGSLKTVS
jgi:hypothetical protein